MVRATRLRRLRIQRAMQAATVVVGTLVVATVLSLAIRKDVTLVVGTLPNSISTTSSNVLELLETTGLPLAVGLQVAPPPATPLADGMTVVVSPPPGLPADALSGMVGPTGVGVWVVERSGEGLFGKAASESDAAMTAPVTVGLTPVVSVRVVVSGKVHDVLTNASTAGALLSAMGIQPDADDRVAPSPGTPLNDGLTVRYDSIEVRTERVVSTIPFMVHTTYSEDMLPGQLRVTAEGRDGLREDVFTVILVNGRERSRDVVSSQEVYPAIDETRVSGPYSMYDGTTFEPGTGATTQAGRATWYDPPWSGYTAAHPWLPFGTRVTVTGVGTGRSVTVVIDDRGPFAPGKIIDLSPEAFSALAPTGRGVLDVSLEW